MREKLDPKELVTFDELTLSNAWELETLVESADREGNPYEAAAVRGGITQVVQGTAGQGGPFISGLQAVSSA